MRNFAKTEKREARTNASSARECTVDQIVCSRDRDRADWVTYSNVVIALHAVFQ